jgi:hypothetical protein
VRGGGAAARFDFGVDHGEGGRGRGTTVRDSGLRHRKIKGPQLRGEEAKKDDDFRKE